MPTKNPKDKKYKRILLKLSGEELMGDGGFGIDPKVLDKMALEIGQLVGIGVQVGLDGLADGVEVGQALGPLALQAGSGEGRQGDSQEQGDHRDDHQ